MKVVAIVAVVLALSVAALGQDYSDDERKRILKNREDCIAETKVNPEYIDRADRGDFVDDDKLKCFTKCFYQKAGFVTDTGALLLDTIKAKIPANVDKEQALKIIEKCQQAGKDACETVYLVHKCYFQHTHVPEPGKQQEGKSQPIGPDSSSTNIASEKQDLKEPIQKEPLKEASQKEILKEANQKENLKEANQNENLKETIEKENTKEASQKGSLKEANQKENVKQNNNGTKTDVKSTKR